MKDQDSQSDSKGESCPNAKYGERISETGFATNGFAEQRAITSRAGVIN